MPRLILETHLRTLHSWLLETRSSNEITYAPLLRSADGLRAERTRYLSDPDLDELDQRFENDVASTSLSAQGIGRLIGSAIADEANGLRKSTGSLIKWLTDAERFPPPWTDTVARTLAEARRRAHEASRG